MPDNLFGETASLAQGNSRTADSLIKARQNDESLTQGAEQTAGKSASNLAGILQNQEKIGQNKMALDQNQAKLGLDRLKILEGYINVTPQMALGNFKMTGDPGWLSMQGKALDGRVYSSILSAGVRNKTNQLKENEPGKVYTFQEGENQYQGTLVPDPSKPGSFIVRKLSKGGPKFNPEVGKSNAAKSAATNQKGMEDFVKDYEQAEKKLFSMEQNLPAKPTPEYENDLKALRQDVEDKRPLYNDYVQRLGLGQLQKTSTAPPAEGPVPQGNTSNVPSVPEIQSILDKAANDYFNSLNK